MQIRCNKNKEVQKALFFKLSGLLCANPLGLIFVFIRIHFILQIFKKALFYRIFRNSRLSQSNPIFENSKKFGANSVQKGRFPGPFFLSFDALQLVHAFL